MDETPQVTVKPCANGRDLTLTLPDGSAASLNAENAVVLIRRLSEVRANLKPPFPAQDPSPATVMMHDDRMRWYVVPNSDGGVSIALMHPGFGWVWITLKPEPAAEFRRVVMGTGPTTRPPRAN